MISGIVIKKNRKTEEKQDEYKNEFGRKGSTCNGTTSEKFNVDIKIFTFEQGLEFTQEIEISKGKILKDIVLKYGDYRWEVAFSNLGG
ncbi:TPA: hypothetical protein ACGJGJ_001785 [Streptococcus pneumoniae]